MKVAQLLGLWGPWQCQVCRDTDCLHHRSYGPIRVFFQGSCSWRSEGPFGQSFSVASTIQALRGLSCLGSYSVDWHVKALKGAPWVGHLCSSVCQAIDGPASLLFSSRFWHVGRERLWCWLYPLHVTQLYHLASMAAWLSSSTGISHHNLLPYIPSIHLSAVNSSPCDCSTIPKLQFPATEPSRGRVSLSGVCMAAARTDSHSI